VKTLYKWIASVVAVIAAAFFLMKKTVKRGRFHVKPPKGAAEEVFIEEIQEDLDEGLREVTEAITGSDPSEDLAELGNKRSRR